MTDPSQLRVSNTDREAVAALLSTAAGEGRLTMDEVDERMQQAFAARTFADLDVLVADLPVTPPSQSIGPGFGAVSPAGPGGVVGAMAPGRVPARPEQRGMEPGRPLLIDAGWSSQKRDGEWDIPPFLALDGGVGSIKLNCLRARPLADTIAVSVKSSVGSVLIIAPHGWGSIDDDLSRGMGSYKSDLPQHPQLGFPLLVFSGSTGMGSVRVRFPRGGELRKAGLA
ncbi:DUF1707 SHOCT-like domain-containing protein [Nakamurella aerolata]|uniref:DUF1707 domain-containing protein n=1 Tax=Nakamurella aerolata TaxID=1656892 RepID=A0A849AEE1_9ACTN|nr:DUF1707 domain-containing protein [Nakamurella aerolata]NNG37581.1 DUF1707 domain-containing protein [Nakamurella aerolata]